MASVCKLCNEFFSSTDYGEILKRFASGAMRGAAENGASQHKNAPVMLVERSGLSGSVLVL